jgi:hypothetical protein
LAWDGRSGPYQIETDKETIETIGEIGRKNFGCYKPSISAVEPPISR